MSRGGRKTNTKLIAYPQSLLRKFNRIRTKNKTRTDVLGEMLKEKIPVHFGGMSDPFANKLVSSVSKDLLTILGEMDYPTVISTKNTNELRKDDSIDVLKNIRNLIIQVSITTLDSELSSKIEPNIPSPFNRIDTLKILEQEGIYTIVRLQPLIPGTIKKISQELIPILGSVGVKHVVVEFLKLPVEQTISGSSALFEEIGFDALKQYKQNQALRTGREWVLPPAYKWEELQPLIESIHNNGMTYGAADYGLNHLGDSNCCCGIDMVNGFSNWYKGNIPYLIRRSKSNFIRYEGLDDCFLPNGSIRMYLNSNCRVDGGFSIADYLRLKWNRPGTANAPDTFLGVSWQGDIDDAGNNVYITKPI